MGLRSGNCVRCGDDFSEFEGHMVEGGPIHMTEGHCTDVVAKSRDAAWYALQAVADFFAQMNWCPLCEKTLYVSQPDKGWRQGHRRVCPLAIVEKQPR
jgi:hypothetical protein